MTVCYWTIVTTVCYCTHACVFWCALLRGFGLCLEDLTEIEVVLNSRRYLEFQEAFLAVSQPHCFSSFTLGRFPLPRKKKRARKRVRLRETMFLVSGV